MKALSKQNVRAVLLTKSPVRMFFYLERFHIVILIVIDKA